MHLNFLYEDNDLGIVHKPAGMLTHPAAKREALPAVSDALVELWGSAFDRTAFDPLRPGIVHRLDCDTSGLLVVAKHATSHAMLSEQFKARSVVKRYIAAVRGRVHADEFILTEPLRRVRGRSHYKMMAQTHPDAKDAETHCECLYRTSTKSIVLVTPKTGRTHQIRVHLANKNHPLIGDRLYGKSSKQYPGHLLHACYLEFTHPTTQKRLAFQLNAPAWAAYSH
ncbi:RNA pseudouridine synthase [bacterium]|nr:RNA pseudouridine synthase [bacterium]|tara:strand:- start:146 stop:820 length:675 start_codon:yes stop_codon:yes gene_type:complete